MLIPNLRNQEQLKIILDIFSRYFPSISTKDDNTHVPTIGMLPCESETNEFYVTKIK